jgi:hypothetical protein
VYRLKSIDSAKLVKSDAGLAKSDATYAGMGMKRDAKVPRFRRRDGSITAIVTWRRNRDGERFTIRHTIRLRFRR